MSLGLAERFWPKVDRRGPNECWPWRAHRCVLGYGRIMQRKGGIGRPLVASRVAWELTFGKIPDGLVVLHRCDNPPCCNPAHLSLGTVAENNADMARKGRASRGINHVHAKLTEDQVLQIRALASYGKTSVEIAPIFGLNARTVRHIVKGDRWAHLPL